MYASLPITSTSRALSWSKQKALDVCPHAESRQPEGTSRLAMWTLFRRRQPVNPSLAPPAMPLQGYRVLDVWHVFSFLIWAHSKGYFFGRYSGQENRIIALNNFVAPNHEREICGLVFEFLGVRGEDAGRAWGGP